MKNIYLNHTLKEYNAKYSNRKYRLLKFTKKEVEEHDKKCPYKTKGYILQGRKWWLIGDTYYEIPRPIRYTWFRNLNGAVQAGVCLLGAGAVTASIVTPLFILTTKAPKSYSSEITGDGKDLIEKVSFAKQSDGSYVGKVILKEGIIPTDIEKISISVDNKELERNKEYTLNIDTGDVKINKDVIKNDNPKIVVSVKRAPQQTEYILELEYYPEEITVELRGAGKYKEGEKAKVYADPSASGYVFEGWYDKGWNKISSENEFEYTVTDNTTLIAYYVSDEEILAEYIYNGYDSNGFYTEVEDEIVEYKIACSNYEKCTKAIIPAVKPETDISVTGLDDRCFEYCTNLKSIEFQSSSKIITIGMGAFYTCSSLKSIKIPSSVVYISYGAFENCESLESVVFEDNENGWETYDYDGILAPKTFNPTKNTPKQNATALSETYIASYLAKNIPIAADLGYIGFDNDGTQVLEKDADYFEVFCKNRHYCSYCELPSTHNGKNITGLYFYDNGYNGIGAFENCYRLESFQFAKTNHITSIEYASFYTCRQLNEITIPKEVTYICSWVFSANQLTKLTFEDYITPWTVEGKTFIPNDPVNNAKIINQYYQCEFYKTEELIEASLGYVGLDDNNIEVDDDHATHYEVYCDDKDRSIPTIAKIPELHNNKKITGIYGGFDEIIDRGFYGCYNLLAVTFDAPENIKRIGDSVFIDCTSLVVIEIPENVTYIGGSSFENCNSLESITIPSKVYKIGSYCFDSCSKLESVTFEDSEKWRIDNGDADVFTPSDPQTNATYLTKNSYDGGYCNYEWTKFGNREKFASLVDEWVVGENGFTKSNTEFMLSDISEVVINNVPVTEPQICYIATGTDLRGFVVSDLTDSSKYFWFASLDRCGSSLYWQILDDREYPEGIVKYKITNEYAEYEVDESVFDDPYDGDIKYIKINKYGYVEKYISYGTDDWNVCSIKYADNVAPHEFTTSIAEEPVTEGTYITTMDLEDGKYYKVGVDHDAYGFTLTIGDNNLNDVFEEYIAKDSDTDDNIYMELSEDGKSLDISNDENNVRLKFKCKKNISAAEIKFVEYSF